MLESTFYLFLYCSWPAQCLAQSGYLTNTCHRLGFRLWAGILSWLSCIHPTASIILPTTFRDQMAKSRPTARLWGSNICCCLFLYILIFIYVFIWLYRVLVVACGIFFFFEDLFILGCAGSSLLCRLSLVAVSRGYSLLPSEGFSLRLLLLWSTGSGYTGFSSSRTWAQKLWPRAQLP